MTGPVSVTEGDYIAVLEDELSRECRARRVLAASLRSKERVLAAYVDRYGDITETPVNPEAQEVPDARDRDGVG